MHTCYMGIDHAYMLYGYRSCIHVIWVSIMYTCYMGIDFTSVSMKRIWNFSDGVVFLFFITLGKEEQQKEAIPEIKLLLFLFLCTSVYLLYKPAVTCSYFEYIQNLT